MLALDTDLSGKKFPIGEKAFYEIERKLWINHGIQYYLARDQTGKCYFFAVTDDRYSKALKRASISFVDLETELNRFRQKVAPDYCWAYEFEQVWMRAWRQGRLLQDKAQVPPLNDLTTRDVHFEWYFPRVVTSPFAWPHGATGDLTAVVLDVEENYEWLIPLRDFPKRGLRINIGTSVWMVSQMLEMMAVHSYYWYDDIANYLVDPTTRRLVYLNCAARDYPRNNLTHNARNLSGIAKIALELIGARLMTGADETWYDVPHWDAIGSDSREYVRLLINMAEHPETCLQGIRYTADVQDMFYTTACNWSMTRSPQRFLYYPLDGPNWGECSEIERDPSWHWKFENPKKGK